MSDKYKHLIQKKNNGQKDHYTLKPTLELINVSFDAERGPDRHTSLCALGDLIQSCFRKSCPDVRLSFFLVDRCLEDIDASNILSLLGPNSTLMDFNVATALWCGSEGRGFRLRWWREVEEYRNEGTGAKVGEAPDEDERVIGAVQQEMQILQELIDQAHVPLFKKPGAEKRCGNLLDSIRNIYLNQDSAEMDKSSASLSSKLETTSIHGGKIDCSLYRKHYLTESLGQDQIGSAKVRHNSTMFHENDQCLKGNSRQHELSRAQGRVLLVGHGADELMGGYARHISAFDKRGQEGLIKEMGVDLTRLWQRNMGRDDRVLSDFGRESRHPFLDEEFIQCVRSVPPLVDKLYLRAIAAETDIGLITSAALFEKRAIQFGTRIAQKSNKARYGSNRKGKGTDPFVMK